MHHRRVKPCRPVRDPAVAVLARLGHFDEGRKAAQGAVLGAAGDAQVQRRTEDHLARTDRPARRHGNGVGLSSQGGAVQHRGP